MLRRLHALPTCPSVTARPTDVTATPRSASASLGAAVRTPTFASASVLAAVVTTSSAAS